MARRLPYLRRPITLEDPEGSLSHVHDYKNCVPPTKIAAAMTVTVLADISVGIKAVPAARWRALEWRMPRQHRCSIAGTGCDPSSTRKTIWIKHCAVTPCDEFRVRNLAFAANSLGYEDCTRLGSSRPRSCLSRQSSLSLPSWSPSGWSAR